MTQLRPSTILLLLMLLPSALTLTAKEEEEARNDCEKEQNYKYYKRKCYYFDKTDKLYENYHDTQSHCYGRSKSPHLYKAGLRVVITNKQDFIEVLNKFQVEPGEKRAFWTGGAWKENNYVWNGDTSQAVPRTSNLWVEQPPSTPYLADCVQFKYGTAKTGLKTVACNGGGDAHIICEFERGTRARLHPRAAPSSHKIHYYSIIWFVACLAALLPRYHQ